MSLSESNNREVVLVIFLIKLAKYAPCLTVLSIFLDLSLQTEDCLLRFLFVNELFGML
jgi:hypothetical protein